MVACAPPSPGVGVGGEKEQTAAAEEEDWEPLVASAQAGGLPIDRLSLAKREMALGGRNFSSPHFQRALLARSALLLLRLLRWRRQFLPLPLQASRRFRCESTRNPGAEAWQTWNALYCALLGSADAAASSFLLALLRILERNKPSRAEPAEAEEDSLALLVSFSGGKNGDAATVNAVSVRSRQSARGRDKISSSGSGNTQASRRAHNCSAHWRHQIKSKPEAHSPQPKALQPTVSSADAKFRPTAGASLVVAIAVAVALALVRGQRFK